ncbi:monooxygenase 1-like [Rhododendron vialii]|uniref:monooxygenase 1-like n=1 Tax=Rhododendron vialii TaxID=182163 RepID=UPI00265EC9DC|nr:monooxygenase 1-like [Rhododendron vialii]
MEVRRGGAAGSGEAEHEHNRDIIIVGGGICGLATALAFHRKGIEKVVVLEKSEKLRATGAGIITRPNGWRALDQLGVAAKLRQTAVPISNMQVLQYKGERKEFLLGDGEMRCLKRADLMQALADDLPPNTLRFGCTVLGIKVDPSTSYPTVHLDDGTVLHAKVVIGCDGINSEVANFLGMNSTRIFSTCSVRGFTSYPSGHKFENKFVRFSKGDVQLGILPVNRNLVYWFITRRWTSQDSVVSNDPKLIIQSSIKALSGFPEEEVEMVRNGDLDQLFLNQLRYRTPWNLLLRRRFGEGSVTVAGDAMHAMGPFIAQGGAAALEDAVVLARCFAETIGGIGIHDRISHREWRMRIEMAIHKYEKERKMRVVKLSAQTFVIGKIHDSSWLPLKLIWIALMVILFHRPHSHTLYDCGQL